MKVLLREVLFRFHLGFDLGVNILISGVIFCHFATKRVGVEALQVENLLGNFLDELLS